MSFMKTACSSFAMMSIFALAPTASANSKPYSTSTFPQAIECTYNTAANHVGGDFLGEHKAITFPGSSKTASSFYRKGVKQFDKGNLEKAERAFEASLRAHGSKTMDQMTLHYLTNLNHKQGDTLAAKQYAEAYFALNTK